MSDVLLLFLIAAGMLATLMVALGVVSIWRGRLPYLTDVVLVLLGVASVGLGVWLMAGPGVPADPLFVDRVTPTTYGPPPPGWTGVPQ